jgi:hypothetical protein
MFVRKPIFGMFHGLTKAAVARPPSPSDVEGCHWRMRWIETQPMQQQQKHL